MTDHNKTSPRIILGVPVSSLTSAQAIGLLDHAIETSQSTPVAFLNAHTAVVAYENTRVRDALQKFTMFNDGIGMDIGCRMKYGTRFSANLNGTDFTPAYLEKTRYPLRIYLLGARSDIVQEAAQILAQRFSRHQIVGFHDGYFAKEQSAEIAAAICATGANLLLVAMGNPMQELWIAEHLEQTGAIIGLGVGALFDFLANRFPRAPRLVRRMRAEWLFRLMCEPKRLWKRYTVGNAKFLAYAVKDALIYRIRH